MSVFLPVFAALAKAEVRYLVVGGLATTLHGHVRMTSDVDIVLELSSENCEKAITALTGAGFKPRAPVDPMSFADAETRSKWINEKGLTVFSMRGGSTLPIEVDIFTEYPFDFEEAWSDRSMRSVQDIEVPVLDRMRLIEMKERIGRPIDMEDAAALRALDDGS